MALHALYPAEPTWNGAVIVGCADDSEGYGACDDGAVYLCCTFPEVAFGGRYPLSLPCGAPVSYTHLGIDDHDLLVGILLLQQLPCGHRVVNGAGLAGGKGNMQQTVSYTHLDVYKRQQ